MTYPRLEALGGIQWPCFDEEHPGELFLHGRLWESPISGPPAPFNVVEHVLPVDKLSDEFPIRLTTGRRLDSYNTGVQSGGYRSPLRQARVARPLARGLRAAGRRRRRAGQGDLAAGVGLRARPDRPDPAPGPGVHDAPLPRRGRDERAHDRRDRPQVGHGRVQGERDPGRPAHGRRAQPGRPHRSSRCPRSSSRGPEAPRQPPDDGRARGGRRRARGARVGVGRRRARRRRPLGPRRPRRARAAASAAPGAPRGPEPGRVDQPGGARIRVPAAHDPAGRGVRRRELLRALRARAARPARDPRVHRHRLHVPRRQRARRRAGADRRPGRRAPRERHARSGSRARAWGCASGRPPCSSPVGRRARRTSTRSPRRGRSRRRRPRSRARPRPSPRRRSCRRPATRRFGSFAASGRSTRRASTATGPRAATRRCARRSTWAPPASSAR